MAIPNTTPTPNELFNGEMKEMKDAELRVVLIVTRATFGWIVDEEKGLRKEEDWISHSQMVEKSGKSSRAISYAISSCIKNNWIEARSENGELLDTAEKRKMYGKKIFYRLGSKFLEKVQTIAKDAMVEPSQNLQGTIAKNDIQPSQNLRTTKETLTKEINTKDISIYNTNKKPNGFGKPELNEGMEYLLQLRGKPINNSNLNRFALNRLVKKYGLDRSCRALKFAFGVVEDEYAPAITDYLSLEKKWDNLEIYARRKMKKANAADIQGSIERNMERNTERSKQVGDIT